MGESPHRTVLCPDHSREAQRDDDKAKKCEEQAPWCASEAGLVAPDSG